MNVNSQPPTPNAEGKQTSGNHEWELGTWNWRLTHSSELWGQDRALQANVDSSPAEHLCSSPAEGTITTAASIYTEALARNMAQFEQMTGANATDELPGPSEVTMTLFDITIAGRRFSIARELHTDHQFHQRYSVDGRDVPVQRYLELIATAVAATPIHVT